MEEGRYSSWMLERIDIGDTVRLRVGVSTIGRHSSSTIRITGTVFVSRQHAEIEVAENDREVYITDLGSINGIYINDQQYSRQRIALNSNDLIGIGLTTNVDEVPDNVTQIPVYKLLYSPLRQIRQGNINRSAVAPPVEILTPTPPPSPLEEENVVKSNDNETNKNKEIKNKNNLNSDDEKPCCSKSIKKEEKNIGEEIFEISDDDVFDYVVKPKTYSQNSMSNETKKEVIIKEEPNNSLQNCVQQKNDIIIDSDKEDIVNPSQKNLKLSLEIKEKDKIQPQVSESLPNQKIILHEPIISSVKKEIIRSVSADIQNIFGDIREDIDIQKKIKEINPLVYNEMQASKQISDKEQIMKNGDIFTIIDDEDFDVEELGILLPSKAGNEHKETHAENCTKSHDMLNSSLETSKENAKEICMPSDAGNELKERHAMNVVKSPNILDSSLDSSKEDAKESAVQKQQAMVVVAPIDNIDLDEYTTYIPNSDDEDIEELMFSQVLMNDMKAELQDDYENQSNLELPNLNAPISNVGSVVVKKEPQMESFASVPKELENSCWIISDDEDIDEELETKVNDWSNRIFSQSFNQMNMSQVYDLNEPAAAEDDDDVYGSDVDDNLNFLEYDLDYIADLYNNTERDVEGDMKHALNKLDEKEFDVNENKDEKQSPHIDSTISNKSEEHFQTELICRKAKSPIREISASNSELIDSPVIRTRRLSKSKPVIESTSSSENEMDDAEQQILPEVTKQQRDLIKPSVVRLAPLIIDAPSLPKYKGKLRGVSASLPESSSNKTQNLQKKISSLKGKIKHDQHNKDLKRKWIEKPSSAKKRDKELKERRRDKLKELAERKKSSQKKETTKRKVSTQDHQHKPKVAKVKVTTHNRGAFLTNNEPTSSPQLTVAHKPDQKFKIPKINKKPEESKCSPSIDCFDTFSQQISKPDELVLNCPTLEAKKCDKTMPTNKIRSKPVPKTRQSIKESIKRSTSKSPPPPASTPAPPNTICKNAIAARAFRTTNKITFASMENNISENEEIKRKLSVLNSNVTTPLTGSMNDIQVPSILKKLSLNKNKKTVRFNDTPVIHYIERVSGASKKVVNKDVMPKTTYKDRRHLIRSTYPIIDKTDDIITNILLWSNEWLIKRNAAVEAASEIMYPMPTHFNSFDHYKSIIFPLMKLEFVSILEREYNLTKKLNNFKVSLEYATLNKDRIMLVTRLNSQKKEHVDNSLFDLVILEMDKAGPLIFAFIAATRRSAGACTTIVYEILAKNFTAEYFTPIKELFVRPVIDKVRVHFGSFNAVHQLEATPLFQKIINPFELVKCKPPPKRKIIYKGFDKLNAKQEHVLIDTYTKIIDESTSNITLIQGPPGTGKSCVITNLILQTLYGDEVRFLDKKILFCAQSNTAVDVIAAKLYDISMRMRPEKRFRLIRYGMLNKIHPYVLPVALQKVVQHDQLKKLQAKNKDLQIENKENLKNQIMHFEAQVAEMSLRNIKGTVEEDLLLEKQRQLQLMKNILNQSMRPDDERSLYTWYLSNANVVCATLSSCVSLMLYINFFDVCIIDEATQCTEPWTILPLKFGINSLVLVGDTQQLPATILSKKANELGLGKSMFTRIQNCLDDIACSARSKNDANSSITQPNNIIYSLQTQYRMHPEICRWPNQYFYRNELISAKQTLDLNKSPLMPFSILSLAYTQNNACINGQITNNLEAEFVAKLLKALDGFIPNKYNSYGVITPYAQQRNTLEASIRSMGITNIMANTIDSYQGLEKDVIVISNTRTHGIGFLSNPQRLNVALTRAKKCLIVCGNFKNLETVPAWRCLLENARERKLYHEITEDCIVDIQTNVIEKIKLTNYKP